MKRKSLYFILLVFTPCLIPSSQACEEPLSLARRRDNADVIVTGIALGTNGDSATINIIQVLKDNSHRLGNPPGSLTIQGFNNPNICQSAIEVNLVKIIMTNFKNGGYYLNSSLVDVSIDSLNTLRDTPNPCDRVQCGYGSTCQNIDGQPTCHCISCPDPQGETPVCGSDEIQYASECFFKRAVCLQSLHITIAKFGPCIDPCARVRCGYGSTCVPTADYRSATCQCPELCTAEYKPVCTESGEQFSNECELNKKRCLTRSDIEVKYYGACDPCEAMQCPENTVCRIESGTREAVCSCGQRCLSEVHTVCGTDGREYTNECELQKQACVLNKNIEVVHEGTCSQLVNDPCEMVTCSRYQECVRSESYGACSCMFNCPDVYKPVCGKYTADDAVQDFDSECHLKLSACRQQRDIDLYSYGLCENIDTGYSTACESYNCPLGQACTLNSNNEAVCDCAPSCDDYPYAAVCGTNFKTYRNQCELKRSNCIKKTEVDVLYETACPDPCDSITCENYGICKSVEDTGKCHCPEDEDCSVSDKHEIVCGSDGVTYQHLCEMKKTACNTNTALTVSYYGYCFKDDACLDVTCNKYATCQNGDCICEKCDDVPTNPVCATNNESFDSECKMRRFACLKSEDISVFHTGRCINDNFGNEYDLDQKLLWQCSEKCIGGDCVKLDQIWQCVCPSCDDNIPINAICGENNITYNSECFLKRAMCMEHKYIDILHYGQCESNAKLCPENTEIITLPKGYLTCKSADHCPVSSVCHYQNCCFNHTVAGDCSSTRYGCCDDKQTHALGSRKQGCPEVCTCNPYGSYGNRCDAFNQCVCRRGVTGKQCDRCTHGYWNFLRMTVSPTLGCQECKCNINGSQRVDCDQTNGHCLCKEGVFGEKCNLCPIGLVLSPEGCVTEEQLATQKYYQSCDSVKCEFGATCVQRDIYAQCECPISCPEHVEGVTGRVVCASDGQSYKNECNMVVTACAQSKNITVRSYGECGSHEYDDIMTSDDENSLSQSDSIFRLDECDLHPCLHGGECIPTQTGHKCICPIGFGERDCNQIFHVKIPTFDAFSYLEFPQLVGYQNHTMEINVKPSSETGIILYIGPDEMDHSSQYFSLVLIRGILELRYSLNGDVGVISTALSLTIDTWHRIVIKHFNYDMVLMVDYDEELQSGMILRSTTQVSSSDIRLTDNIRVGGVAQHSRKAVFGFLAVSEGFTGCMTGFRVNAVNIDMSYPDSSELVGGAGITRCDYNPCKMRPCQNEATCVVTDSYNYHCICNVGFDGNHCEFIDNPCLGSPCQAGGKCQVISNKEFKCHCPLGRRGLNCEKEIRMNELDIFQPSFNLDSYLRTQNIINAEQSLNIEMWFYTRKLQGLLLFAGESIDTDFICLMLMDHRVEFKFDYGMGIGSVRAEEKLSPHTWNKVTVYRSGLTMEISLNDGPKYPTIAVGSLLTLNLETPLYVGGHPELEMLKPIGVENGFKGAVQKLEFNKQIFIGNKTVDELNDVFDLASNVMVWDNHECFLETPCSGNQRCLPLMDSHVCDCMPHETCDYTQVMSDQMSALYFPGDQVLPFYNGKTIRETSQESNKIALAIRTTTGNGLIIWSNEGSMKDMFALSLWNGFLKAEIELGAGKMETYSLKPVNDGKWHDIIISRDVHVFNLQVDNDVSIRSYLPVGASKLDTDGLLWVGGHPFLSSAEENLPVNIRSSFVGCISYLSVGDQPINFLQDMLIKKAVEYCSE